MLDTFIMIHYSYEAAMKLILRLGSPQPETLYLRFATFGRLSTTVLKEDVQAIAKW